MTQEFSDNHNFKSFSILGSIVLSISACHVKDPGSISGRIGSNISSPTNFDRSSLLSKMAYCSEGHFTLECPRGTTLTQKVQNFVQILKLIKEITIFRQAKRFSSQI
jgi:hypothetical protein